MTTEAENKATGEMVDKIRNEGTMVGKVMVDREVLESIVENRIKLAIIETYEGMVTSIEQWKKDNPIKPLDPSSLNLAVIALSNDTAIDMFKSEIERLKG